jgi:Thioredoxin reductase
MSSSLAPVPSASPAASRPSAEVSTRSSLRRERSATRLSGTPPRWSSFSTPGPLEIGGHPFPTRDYKPRREEALDYYRGVATAEDLNLRLYEPVTDLRGQDGGYTVVTEKGTHEARKVVVSTGFYDVPNRMEVPGEDLDKVQHYFKEPYPYALTNVAVVGGANSAAKAALKCYRHEAHVTMVVREPEIDDSVKYWLRPDVENRIEEGSIDAYFNTTVSAIEPDTLHLNTPDGPETIDNDFVLAMTGYKPNYDLLERLGIAIRNDAARTPVHDRGAPSKRTGTACTSPAPSVAGATRAAGSSRTAAPTPRTSWTTSPRRSTPSPRWRDGGAVMCEP